MMESTSGNSTASNLDRKDMEILRLLQRNAKLTVREIADKISLSATPTHERIKRMENDGTIRQYAALLDHKRIKKGIMVICSVSLKKHDKKTAKHFLHAVADFNEVIECYNISGEFDFLLKVVAESMEAYHKFYVNKLSEVKGIGNTKSSFVMDVIKETHIVV